MTVEQRKEALIRTIVESVECFQKETGVKVEDIRFVRYEDKFPKKDPMRMWSVYVDIRINK